jgi:hypothetical protein
MFACRRDIVQPEPYNAKGDDKGTHTRNAERCENQVQALLTSGMGEEPA